MPVAKSQSLPFLYARFPYGFISIVLLIPKRYFALLTKIPPFLIEGKYYFPQPTSFIHQHAIFEIHSWLNHFINWGFSSSFSFIFNPLLNRVDLLSDGLLGLLIQYIYSAFTDE